MCKDVPAQSLVVLKTTSARCTQHRRSYMSVRTSWASVDLAAPHVPNTQAQTHRRSALQATVLQVAQSLSSSTSSHHQQLFLCGSTILTVRVLLALGTGTSFRQYRRLQTSILFLLFALTRSEPTAPVRPTSGGKPDNTGVASPLFAILLMRQHTQMICHVSEPP